jgi:hypothetical protein
VRLSGGPGCNGDSSSRAGRRLRVPAADNLTRNLLPCQQRVTTVGLGNTGNDSFTANRFNSRTGVGSDLVAGSSLIAGVLGGPATTT